MGKATSNFGSKKDVIFNVIHNKSNYYNTFNELESRLENINCCNIDSYVSRSMFKLIFDSSENTDDEPEHSIE